MTRSYLAPGQPPARSYLVHGDDPGLVSQALSALLADLESLDDSGGIPIEEYGEQARGDSEEGERFGLGPLLDACQTPPFLAERRVVVLRDSAALDSAQVKELVGYLADPVETTVLVLVSPSKRAPAALVKAVSESGEVIDTAPGSSGRARTAWITEQLRDAAVRPNPDAVEMLAEHLGEDLSRLDGLVATLESAFGTNAVVGSKEMSQFLGAAGAVPPWELTDAIDSGDAAKSITALGRLLGPGGRSPFVILATLHRHFEAMLRLEGSGVADAQRAAELTGLSSYPARKVLDAARRLGHDSVARAITLLADADFALRGESGWPDVVVMEVLVARLARLSERRAPSRAGGRGTRRR